MFGRIFLILFLLSALISPAHIVQAVGICICQSTDKNCTAVEPTSGKDTDAGCKEICQTKLDTKFSSSEHGLESEVDAKKVACDAIAKTYTDTKAGKADTTKSPPKVLLKPILNVDIPGLSFSNGVVEPCKNDAGKKCVKTNYLGEYLSALFSFMIGTGSIIAIVLVMVGGLQYTLGSASQEQISKGKARMINAVTGLILLLCVFLILYTVNPQLVLQKIVELQVIPEQPLPEERAVSGEFGKKMLKDFPDAPPDKVNPIVPDASSCSGQSSRNSKLTTQADRDAAYAIQKQYGYPAAVFLAQRILEGKTFGIKCGPFMTAAKGDQSAIDTLGCESKNEFCGTGYTWECTKNTKYLPGVPDGAGSPPNNSDCGKGDKAGKGYKAVHGYSCFQKPDPANPFGPLLKFYERKSCFKGAKDKYGGNPEAFAYAVQACGYATAQGYAGTLVNIMKKNCLWNGTTAAPTDSTTSDSSDDKTDTPADPK